MKTGKRIFKGAIALSVGFTTVVGSVIPMVQPIAAAEKEDSYTQYVDNFMGTQGDHGSLFPGSVVPHGIVKLSPQTTSGNRAGYEYSSDKIVGFSHTRIEGVGGSGAGGDVLVTPTYMEYTKKPDGGSKEQKFAKKDDKKIEDASPGYYHTEIVPNVGKDSDYKSDESKGTISAKVSTDVRTGIHNYTFPEEGNANIVVDLGNNVNGRRSASMDIDIEDDKTVSLSGSFSGGNVLSGSYIMYYYMEIEQPVEKVQTWNGNDSKLSTQKTLKGKDIGAVLGFDVDKGETIQAKVSISPISAKQAEVDMHNEMPHWNFEQVRQHADDLWNETLGKVRIESSETSDPDGRLKRLFYTNMYHMFMTPVNATSTSGTYRGTDGKLYKADGYTHYDSWTFWDDYRKYSIIGLVDPEFQRDVAQSVVDMFITGYSDYGTDNMPVLTVRNEYAVTVVADAIKKGFVDIKNLEKAYEKAKEVADFHMWGDANLEHGFCDGRLSDTVTASFEYWGVSILAEALGKKDEAEMYKQKALNYKKIFRSDAPTEQYLGKQIGVLWPKYHDGSWRNCTPDAWQDCNMGQGTLWQYMWYDSYDLNGYIELMGGKENALTVLNYIFGARDEGDDGHKMLHSNVNEIDPQLPYIFNFAGKPSETQYWVRKIFSKKCWNRYRGDGEFNPPIYDYVYKLEPEGFLESMDDDCGTMSSMYVSAAMGIFPMTPGDTNLQIGSPFFEKMTLDVGNGKTFTIEANNVSPDNFYIQSATLNGESFNRSWIDYSEVMNGGTLSFEMGNKPSTWAEDGPTSFSLSDHVETDLENDDITYSAGTFTESEANDGSIENKIQVKVKDNEFVGNKDEDLIQSGKIKVSNVPEGLSAKAIKTADDTVEIQLEGTAKNHQSKDSISDLTIEITDQATKEPVDSIRKIKKDIRVDFSNDALKYSATQLKESDADDGSITETATIRLMGQAEFSGEANEDFVKSNKVSLTNVPEGLTPVVKKTDNHTVVLSFEGKANKDVVDTAVNIAFNDSAFVDASASTIANTALSGMSAFVLDFYADYTSDLSRNMEEAKALDKEDYTDRSYNELMNLVKQGEELLKQEKPNQDEVIQLSLQIDEALDNLKPFVFRDARVRLEGEASDSWSGNGLRNGDKALGSSYNGAWIEYDSIDFDITDIKSVEVSYAGDNNTCPESAHLEIRQDSLDGKVIATLPMKPTGNWSNFQISSTDIESLKGIHDIYAILVGDDAYDDVADIDYIQFSDGTEIDPGEGIKSKKVEFEKRSDWSGNGLKDEGINVGGTYPGAWLKYDQINFDELNAKEISVRYDNNSGRCKPDARIDFYLDNMEGTPFQTVEIPPTASSWGTYKVVTEPLETQLTGTHDVYAVLRGEENPDNPFIANLDWFEFKEEAPVVDKNELTAAYEEYKSILDTESRYTHRTFVRFESAMNSAKEVIDAPEVTQVQIDYTLSLLNKTVELLDYKIEADIANLVAELEKVEGDYTKDSFAKLQVAIETAKNIPEGSAYEVYEAAYQGLLDAKSGLTLLDRTVLQSTVERLSSIDLDQYQDAGKEEFKQLLSEAKELVNTPNINQSDLDNMVQKLNDSFDSLVLKVDKSELDEAIKAAEKLDSSKYTKESWGAFEKALADAKAVLAKEDATQEEVNQALDALTKAKAQLAPVKDEGNTGDEGDKPTPPEKPEVPEKPETPENTPDKGNEESLENPKENTETSDDVNTGAAVQTAGLVTALALGGAAMVYAERKRRLNQRNEK